MSENIICQLQVVHVNYHNRKWKVSWGVHSLYCILHIPSVVEASKLIVEAQVLYPLLLVYRLGYVPEYYYISHGLTVLKSNCGNTVVHHKLLFSLGHKKGLLVVSISPLASHLKDIYRLSGFWVVEFKYIHKLPAFSLLEGPTGHLLSGWI